MKPVFANSPKGERYRWISVLANVSPSDSGKVVPEARRVVEHAASEEGKAKIYGGFKTLKEIEVVGGAV
jgi:hypothetical protein